MVAITSEISAKKIFLLIFFLFMLYLSYLIVKPYLVAVFFSFVLAYLLYPLHKHLKKYVKYPSLSALLILTVSFIIIIGIAYFTANSLIDESTKLYQNLRSFDINAISQPLTEIFGNNIEFEAHIKNAIGEALTFILQELSDFVFSLPQYVLGFFVALFVLYYLLKEGDKIGDALKNALPFRQKEKALLIERFQVVFKATIFGIIGTALAQGIIGTIGLVIFQAPSPLFFGAIMVVAATLPYLGASLVWFPIALYMISTGDVYNGIGLMIFGLLIISTIDNLVRPYIVSKQSQLHPIITLLGVLGGIVLFGFAGVIIGPLVLALLITLIEFYVSDYEA